VPTDILQYTHSMIYDFISACLEPVFAQNGITDYLFYIGLTLTLLSWRIWWAPNNASKWQIGFNLSFKWLNDLDFRWYCIFVL